MDSQFPCKYHLQNLTYPENTKKTFIHSVKSFLYCQSVLNDKYSKIELTAYLYEY